MHGFHFTVLLLVAAAACDRAESTGPTTTATRVKPGALSVTVVTHGLPIDPDGYDVAVLRSGDFAPTAHQRVGTNGNATFSGLSPGRYLVWLEDVAPPCWPAKAGPPRSDGVIANVNSDSIADVELAVECPSSGYGYLHVSVRTSLLGAGGSAAAPPTWKWPVRVDEAPARFVPANGSIQIDSIAPGPHLVELKAGGCLVSAGSLPFSTKMTVFVQSDAIAHASFKVMCIP